jgi:hypothetical protein
MSNHANELIMEGLADEFYDDQQQAIEWMVAHNAHLGGLTEDEMCDLFVQMSLEMMQ